MLNANGGLFGGNVTLSKAGLTGLSGAGTTYSTGATSITYALGGKIPAQKAQVSGAAAPIIDAVTGKAFRPVLPNQGCAFVWTLDINGNVGVAQGPLPISPTTTGTQTNVDDSGNWSLLPQFPSLPDTLTPFAYSIIRAQSTASVSGFQFGATNWNATGIVIAVADVFDLPVYPQIN